MLYVVLFEIETQESKYKHIKYEHCRSTHLFSGAATGEVDARAAQRK